MYSMKGELGNTHVSRRGLAESTALSCFRPGWLGALIGLHDRLRAIIRRELGLVGRTTHHSFIILLILRRTICLIMLVAYTSCGRIDFGQPRLYRRLLERMLIFDLQLDPFLIAKAILMARRCSNGLE